MATTEKESNQECKQWGFPVGTIQASTNEELQEVYKSLECPVCHEFPGPRVYSCANNLHMFCEKCVPVSRICPLCSAKISDTPCDPVEKCITDFLTPCKYKFEGCPQLLRGNDVREHVQSCLYRPIFCVMLNCEALLPFKELFNHLTTVHENKINGVLDSSSHVIEWWIEGSISDVARWPPFYFTCFNNVFLYMCLSTIHGTWEWISILANEEEARRFRVESRLEGYGKIVSIQFKGPVHSIRKPIKDIISSGQVFVTNSKEIRNPYVFRKTGTNKYYWRTDVQIYQVSPPIPTSIPYLLTNEGNKADVLPEKAGDNKTYTIRTMTVNKMLPSESEQINQRLNDSMELKDENDDLGQQERSISEVEQREFNNLNKKTPSSYSEKSQAIIYDNPNNMRKEESALNASGILENSNSSLILKPSGRNNQVIVDSEYSLRLDGDMSSTQNLNSASEIETQTIPLNYTRSRI